MCISFDAWCEFWKLANIPLEFRSLLISMEQWPSDQDAVFPIQESRVQN